MSTPFIRLEGVSKRYGSETDGFLAVQDVTLDISEGELTQSWHILNGLIGTVSYPRVCIACLRSGQLG